jgi:hypothetical protein
MTRTRQLPTYGPDGKINGMCLSLGFTNGGGPAHGFLGLSGGSHGQRVREHTKGSLRRDRRWEERHPDIFVAWQRREDEIAQFLAERKPRV